MIELKRVTDIPGPKSRALMEQRMKSVARGPFHVTPIFLERAEGSMVWDVDGNEYLDFAGGIGVQNVGHCRPEVVEAIKRQAEMYIHTCFNVIAYEGYVKLCDRLCRIAPGDFAKKALLVNSGAEAVENAVKASRHYTKRPGIIVFEDAFHGRTLLTMTMTSKFMPYKTGFGPFAPEVYRIPYAYCYRCSFGLKYPECGLHCVEYLDDFFITHTPADRIAAVVVEPVLGEGGFVVPPKEYLGCLHEKCREHGIILVDDEVQSGCGRTGTLLACEHFDLEPDVITMAKSMGAGVPISAVVGRAEVMDSAQAGGLGGTYCGNPLACASSLAVFDILENGTTLAHATRIGGELLQHLREMQQRFEIIGDVRGLGTMSAVELVKNRKTKTPAKEETGRIAEECFKNGLITITAGTRGNVMRFLMPITITDEQLKKGLKILEGALSKVTGQ
ncbi:MAG TPA: 4-aminobutyrate--2-oxoglutarate transaminase [Acidobacteriota bacterium]|nr:4-aminobutyrate--2-oxoglutarate transaminase [Acidobacteriota bacterium]